MKFIKKLFPSTEKTIGMIVIVAAGVLIYQAANKFFGIEGKLPRQNKMRAA